MPCVEELMPGGNYIVEAVKSIDRMQKEASISQISGCITCETAFISTTNNTIPFSLFTSSGTFLAAPTTATDPTTTTQLFRVECIRDNHYATLRLIEYADTTFTCLNQTITVDLECFCGIQCFPAITCPACGSTTT